MMFWSGVLFGWLSLSAICLILAPILAGRDERRKRDHGLNALAREWERAMTGCTPKAPERIVTCATCGRATLWRSAWAVYDKDRTSYYCGVDCYTRSLAAGDTLSEKDQRWEFY